MCAGASSPAPPSDQRPAPQPPLVLVINPSPKARSCIALAASVRSPSSSIKPGFISEPVQAPSSPVAFSYVDSEWTSSDRHSLFKVGAQRFLSNGFIIVAAVLGHRQLFHPPFTLHHVIASHDC
jgi:hypothetical protein